MNRWRKHATPAPTGLWRQYGIFVILGASLVSAIALWARLTDPSESSSVIAGALGIVVGAIVGLGLEFARRRIDQQERLSALALLLWADLGTASLRLRLSSGPFIEQIDVSLWKDIRVELVRAGLDVRQVASLNLFYDQAEKWNRTRVLMQGIQRLINPLPL